MTNTKLASIWGMARQIPVARLVSCGLFLLPSGCNGERSSETAAYVSPKELQSAQRIVEGINYLPHRFIDDGCYARALYTSMELAAEGIPSSSQFAFPTDRNRPLKVGDVDWHGGHVAPVLVSADKAYVLDSSIDRRPLLRTAWLAKMGGVPVKLLLVPGSTYGFGIFISGPEEPIEGIESNKIIKSFEELPPFELDTIDHAFRANYKYIRYEAESDKAARQGAIEESIRRKRSLLVERTGNLIQRLNERKKITGYTDGRAVVMKVEPDGSGVDALEIIPGATRKDR